MRDGAAGAGAGAGATETDVLLVAFGRFQHPWPRRRLAPSGIQAHWRKYILSQHWTGSPDWACC